MSHFFTRHILDWYRQNPRPLPWSSGPRDPYHIWISEVIMQQTRIEQGAPYYQKFITRFPSVSSLARASVDEVLREWQGLGYYTRARNLHKTAQYIVQNLDGSFPISYDGLLALPGIGPYSAAAIASFAYGLPYPVVDGNVKRLISRFAGIHQSIESAAAHQLIRQQASGFMNGESPAEFNQAIMNFGALICKPKGALCNSCPLAKKCFAFTHQLVETLPVISKKKPLTERYFHFIVFHHQNKILLLRREEKDIWNGLYTPPLLESGGTRKPPSKKINTLAVNLLGHDDIEFNGSSEPVQQLLSHQKLYGRFYHFNLMSPATKKSSGLIWASRRSLSKYGKPKMVAEMQDLI